MKPHLAAWAAAGGFLALLSLPASAADRVYLGPHGGSYAVSSGCVAGVIDRCYRRVTATGPEGRSYVAARTVLVRPAPVRRVGVVHVQGGPTVVRTTRWFR
jgi:hypothetical protein